MLEAEQIMKRCQIGTRNYEEANNLHAECYRIIGKLLAERKPLTDEEAFKLVEQDNRMEEYVEAAVRLIRRTEAAHGIKENT